MASTTARPLKIYSINAKGLNNPKGISILGGDFNMPLDPRLDSSTGAAHLRYSMIRKEYLVRSLRSVCGDQVAVSSGFRLHHRYPPSTYTSVPLWRGGSLTHPYKSHEISNPEAAPASLPVRGLHSLRIRYQFSVDIREEDWTFDAVLLLSAQKLVGRHGTSYIKQLLVAHRDEVLQRGRHCQVTLTQKMYLTLKVSVSSILQFLAVISYLMALLFANKVSSKPNFVLMMADHLGIGDIGCFGNDTIRTPHIDKLAKEGVKLTQHIAAAICTPSRAAFLTGRYPFRSGMDFYATARALFWTGSSGGLPPNETTFAKILQKQGYTTGIIGKWHQGVNCETMNDFCHHPLNHGFNYFYGMPLSLIDECQTSSPSPLYTQLSSPLSFYAHMIGVAVATLIVVTYSNLRTKTIKLITYCSLFGLMYVLNWYIHYGFINYWNCILMRNHEITEQPMDVEKTTLRMLKEAHQFIESNKNVPFLLFVSFLHVHTPLVTTKKFIGNSRHGIYGDNVEEMDFMVGAIVDAIDNKGLKNNTLVYFASDHGGHLEITDGTVHIGGWNGVYKGGKGMAGWEGGIRVPGIFRWPNIIPSDTVIDEPTSLMDIYPTVVQLGGGEIPKDRIIDGRSLVPLLKNQTSHSEHEFLFHYCGRNLHAVRWHQKESGDIWKAHYITPVFYPKGAVGCYNAFMCTCEGGHVTHHEHPLLYELSTDPSESNPLQSQSELKYEAVIHKIELAIAEHIKTITNVPQQLSLANIMWKPWLQLCCGTFPFCWCDKENKNET
ncbi:LOW QUALITY PROTEIN: arylsulfatase H-like [Pelodytes ibericus]